MGSSGLGPAAEVGAIGLAVSSATGSRAGKGPEPAGDSAPSAVGEPAAGSRPAASSRPAAGGAATRWRADALAGLRARPPAAANPSGASVPVRRPVWRAARARAPRRPAVGRLAAGALIGMVAATCLCSAAPPTAADAALPAAEDAPAAGAPKELAASVERCDAEAVAETLDKGRGAVPFAASAPGRAVARLVGFVREEVGLPPGHAPAVVGPTKRLPAAVLAAALLVASRVIPLLVLRTILLVVPMPVLLAVPLAVLVAGATTAVAATAAE